jgi:hypothetical protein
MRPERPAPPRVPPPVRRRLSACGLVVTSTSGGYQAYPIAPRMGFVTLQATF